MTPLRPLSATGAFFGHDPATTLFVANEHAYDIIQRRAAMARSGFTPGIGGPTGKDALRTFLAALMSAPDGALFEVGTMWVDRWYVYMRVGDTALKMAGREARHMADALERGLALPEYALIRGDWAANVATIRECAKEVAGKNSRGERPDGWQVSLPAEGGA